MGSVGYRSTSAGYFYVNLGYKDGSLECLALSGSMCTEYGWLAFRSNGTQEEQGISFDYYDNETLNSLRQIVGFWNRNFTETDAKFSLLCGDGIEKTIAEVICGMHDTEVFKVTLDDKNKVYSKK